MDHPLKLFTGNSHPTLATAIAEHVGVPLGTAFVGRFADGETRVRMEENVRGADCYIIQPTRPPVNEHLMELLIMIDALRRASAWRISAVIPYFGYAKQEKKTAGREPITAKLVANLLTVAGAHRVIALDLHTPAIEGFFDIPVDHLRAAPLLAGYYRGLNLSNVVAVSPDAGGVARAHDFRNRLGGDTDLAIVFKHRPSPEVAEVLEVVGHVKGCTAIIVDDLIQSGGTLVQAAVALKEHGAEHVFVAATHAILVANALNRLAAAPIDALVVTDSVPVPEHSGQPCLNVVSVAPLIGAAIRRIHEQQSVSALF